MSLAGTVLDPNGFIVAAADTFDDLAPAACFTGADHLVVWSGVNTNTGYVKIDGALVSPAGTITRPRFAISRTGYPQAPTVARGSASLLVAWADGNNGAIYAARVRADGAVLDTNGLLVDSSSPYNELPHVTANAAGFKVLWSRYDYSLDTTIYAVAQVDTAGGVERKGDWFGLSGSDDGFDAVYGSGPDLLLLYSCYTDTAFGHVYGSYRLWGRLDAVPGIEETPCRPTGAAEANAATVVRGALLLQEATSRKRQAASLLDISGRKVMDLHAGTNDVSHLAPGVYFVREAQAQAQAQAVRKVVVTK